MNTQKKRDRNENSEGDNKKARINGQPDFLSDGLNNDAIRVIVKEILSIIWWCNTIYQSQTILDWWCRSETISCEYCIFTQRITRSKSSDSK